MGGFEQVDAERRAGRTRQRVVPRQFDADRDGRRGRDAVFRNIEFDGNNAIGSQQPHRYLTVDDNGYLKTENILFENWTVRSFGHPLQLFVDNGIVLRDFGHMTFRNFTVKSKRPFMVRGNAASPVRDMHFENIKGSVAGKPFDIVHASIDFGQIDVSVGK